MTHSKPCILIADDEVEIRKMLHITLSASDYKVVEAETGKEALRLAGSVRPDVILLDLALPDMKGMDVITQLREWSDIPVVVVADHAESDDVVEAFERGADDYMDKPFDMDILQARLQAAIKHTFQKELGESALQAGDIAIDLVRHEVSLNGEKVDLSPKEYELLSYLMRHQGKMLTHRQILKEVWGDAHTHDKQYLRVYIMQLRQKLEADPEAPEYIFTESGIGYRMDIPKRLQAA